MLATSILLPTNEVNQQRYKNMQTIMKRNNEFDSLHYRYSNLKSKLDNDLVNSINNFNNNMDQLKREISSHKQSFINK